MSNDRISAALRTLCAAALCLGATIAQVADGLRHFRPTAGLSPGRMNLFTLDRRTIIVDFAHNEAGTRAILDVAAGIAGGAAGRTAPVTAIIGTAGDRPDDTLRGIGRIAAERAQRVVIKETPLYLRGRSREDVRARTLSSRTPSSERTDSTISCRCSALEASTVTSRIFTCFSTRTRSIAPSDPPASPTAFATRAKVPGASDRRTRRVAL